MSIPVSGHAASIKRIEDRVALLEARPSRAQTTLVTYETAGREAYKNHGTDVTEIWHTVGAFTSRAHSSLALTANRLYLIPDYFDGGRFDKVSILQTAGAAGGRLARLGVFANLRDNCLYPGALLTEFAEYDCSSNVVHTSNGLWQLPKALLWWGIVANAAITLETAIRDGLFASGVSTSLATPLHSLYVAWTYAALPQVAPSGGTWNTTDNEFPIISYRMA